MRGFHALAGVALLASTGIAAAQETPPMVDGFTIAVDQSGAIRLPDADFRADWTLLGTWIVAGGETVDGERGAAGVHQTYTQPGVAERYRKTGAFPDGAVLVKELFGARTEPMTTGVVSHVHGQEGWFVMVKDADGRFEGHPLWGDGWGWAFFDAADPGQSITDDYRAECLDCHVPAQATDWIYVYGYPVLAGPSVAP